MLRKNKSYWSYDTTHPLFLKFILKMKQSRAFLSMNNDLMTIIYLKRKKCETLDTLFIIFLLLFFIVPIFYDYLFIIWYTSLSFFLFFQWIIFDVIRQMIYQRALIIKEEKKRTLALRSTQTQTEIILILISVSFHLYR